MTARPLLMLTFSAVLIGVGAFIAVRPLFTHNATITGQRSIDIMFALYFLVSGTLRFRRVLRRIRA